MQDATATRAVISMHLENPAPPQFRVQSGTLWDIVWDRQQQAHAGIRPVISVFAAFESHCVRLRVYGVTLDPD